MALLGRRINRRQMEDKVILRNREYEYMLNDEILTEGKMNMG
jgi:hypothetical protein